MEGLSKLRLALFQSIVSHKHTSESLHKWQDILNCRGTQFELDVLLLNNTKKDRDVEEGEY